MHQTRPWTSQTSKKQRHSQNSDYFEYPLQDFASLHRSTDSAVDRAQVTRFMALYLDHSLLARIPTDDVCLLAMSRPFEIL